MPFVQCTQLVTRLRVASRAYARAWIASVTLIGTIVLCTAIAPRTASAQVGSEGQAQVRFQHGRQLYAQHDYQNALAEFRGAVSLVGSPNTRLYIARCLHELGRNAEALIEFRRAAAEAADRVASEPRYGVTRDTARSEASAVETRVGAVTVNVADVPEGASVAINGVPVAPAGWGVATPFDPGDAEVTATAPGRVAFRQQVTVHVGETAVVNVELPVDVAAQQAQQASVSPSPAPVEQIAPTPTTHTVRQGGMLRLAGIPVGVIGVAAIVTASVFPMPSPRLGATTSC